MVGSLPAAKIATDASERRRMMVALKVAMREVTKLPCVGRFEGMIVSLYHEGFGHMMFKICSQFARQSRCEAGGVGCYRWLNRSCDIYSIYIIILDEPRKTMEYQLFQVRA